MLFQVPTVFADTIFSKVVMKKDFSPQIPCNPKDNGILIRTETDSKGNKLEIWCNNGQYQLKLTKSDGTVIYLGKCVFPVAFNTAKKQVRYDKITFGNGTSRLENETILRTWWYNFQVPQRPQMSIINGGDHEWFYNPYTGNVTRLDTIHNGTWVGNTYNVTKIKVVENQTFVAPGTPGGLYSLREGPFNGEMHGQPSQYALMTPYPVTGQRDSHQITAILSMPVNGTDFTITPIQATENSQFVFYTDSQLGNLDQEGYSLLKGPEGMTINGSTGTLNWTPGQAGNYSMTVRVHYADNSYDDYSFVLPVYGIASIAPVKIPPSLSLILVGISIEIGIAVALITSRRVKRYNALLSTTAQIIIVFILSAISIVTTVIFVNENSNTSFFIKTVDGYYDISGWATLVVSTGIGIAIAVAVLIYTSAQQGKISEIIKKQNEDDEIRKKFAVSAVRSNLEGTKRIIDEIETINNMVATGDTSTRPDIQRDLEVSTRALRSSFVSNKNLITTFVKAFTIDQIKEIDQISFEAIQYCDPPQVGTIKQTLPNLRSEIDKLLTMLPEIP